MPEISLSNGESYQAQLVVYRDWVESNGKWRLFWARPDDPYKGVPERAAHTLGTFFPTKTAAIAYGEGRYGETAKTAAFHHN